MGSNEFEKQVKKTRWGSKYTVKCTYHSLLLATYSNSKAPEYTSYSFPKSRLWGLFCGTLNFQGSLIQKPAWSITDYNTPCGMLERGCASWFHPLIIMSHDYLIQFTHQWCHSPSHRKQLVRGTEKSRTFPPSILSSFQDLGHSPYQENQRKDDYSPRN